MVNRSTFKWICIILCKYVTVIQPCIDQRIHFSFNIILKTTVDQLLCTHFQLFVGVGVSDYVNKFTLEQHAHNHGYTNQDVKGCPAENSCCILGEKDILVSGIDMVKIRDTLNNSDDVTVETQVSYLDCGRYI